MSWAEQSERSDAPNEAEGSPRPHDARDTVFPALLRDLAPSASWLSDHALSRCFDVITVCGPYPFEEAHAGGCSFCLQGESRPTFDGRRQKRIYGPTRTTWTPGERARRDGKA